MLAVRRGGSGSGSGGGGGRDGNITFTKWRFLSNDILICWQTMRIPSNKSTNY